MFSAKAGATNWAVANDIPTLGITVYIDADSVSLNEDTLTFQERIEVNDEGAAQAYTYQINTLEPLPVKHRWRMPQDARPPP
jgi:hypothetical protein